MRSNPLPIRQRNIVHENIMLLSETSLKISLSNVISFYQKVILVVMIFRTHRVIPPVSFSSISCKHKLSAAFSFVVNNLHSICILLYFLAITPEVNEREMKRALVHFYAHIS